MYVVFECCDGFLVLIDRAYAAVDVVDGASVQGSEGFRFVDVGHDGADPVACRLDGHQGAVDVGEGAIEGSEVADGRRLHRRDGLAL